MKIIEYSRKSLIILTCLLPLVAPGAANPQTFRVFIDAGHGGRDDGARGVFGELEKEISLRLGKLVQESILNDSAAKKFSPEVRLSRESDKYLTLSERVVAANQWGADVFLSLHANSSPVAKARGFEVYFLSPEASDETARALARLENGGSPKVTSAVQSILSDVKTTYHISESSRFAESVFDAMSKILPFGRAIRQAPFTVLEGTSMPAILIEIGYLTNREDSRNLARPYYLKRLANAISLGIVDFVKEVSYENRRTDCRSTPTCSDHA